MKVDAALTSHNNPMLLLTLVSSCLSSVVVTEHADVPHAMALPRGADGSRGGLPADERLECAQSELPGDRRARPELTDQVQTVLAEGDQVEAGFRLTTKVAELIHWESAGVRRPGRLARAMTAYRGCRRRCDGNRRSTAMRWQDEPIDVTPKKEQKKA